MDNCLSKFANKSLKPYMPSLTSGNHEKALSGIQKNHVKYFDAGILRNQKDNNSPNMPNLILNSILQILNHNFNHRFNHN